MRVIEHAGCHQGHDQPGAADRLKFIFNRGSDGRAGLISDRVETMATPAAGQGATCHGLETIYCHVS